MRLSGQAYGVSIKRDIEKRTGREIAFSAVYTTLDRLEKQGLVRSSVGEPTHERGGKRKKFFHLQARGAETLARTHRMYTGMVAGLEEQLENL
jgi:DNA-binding PadR family transcriptional regulator